MSEGNLSLSLDDIIAKTRPSKSQSRGPRSSGREQTGSRKFLSKSRGQGQRPSSAPQDSRQAPKVVKKYVPISTKAPIKLAIRSGGIQKRPNVIYVPADLSSPQSSRRGQGRQPAAEGSWQHDMFEGGRRSAPYEPVRRPAPVAATNGSKIYITNLHHDVTQDDVLELFSSIGTVTGHRINYDHSGRSLGTAEVTFSSPAEAATAKKQYDGIALDGEKMRISLEKDGIDSLLQRLSSGIRVERLPGNAGGAPARVARPAPVRQVPVRQAPVRQQPVSIRRVGGRPAPAGGRGRVRSVVTQEALDAELEAMQQ